MSYTNTQAHSPWDGTRCKVFCTDSWVSVGCVCQIFGPLLVALISTINLLLAWQFGTFVLTTQVISRDLIFGIHACLSPFGKTVRNRSKQDFVRVTARTVFRC